MPKKRTKKGGCVAITVRSHKRCFCNGQLAKSNRCSSINPLGRKKRSKKVQCAPGSIKKSGKRACVCRQVGTGKIRRIQSKRCK
jgi:hypothetical protein